MKSKPLGFAFFLGATLIHCMSEWENTIWPATEDEPLNYVERKVNTFFKHPNYYQDDDNDIGLVKLDQPIEFQANIMPICLPQVDEDFKDKTAWVTGWGDLGL